MRKDILERKDEIIRLISEREPKSKICRELKCRPSTLDNYLKKMNITYKGNMGLRGKKHSTFRKTAVEYSKKEFLASTKLRKKLIEDKIKEDKCEMCGLTEWLGNKLTLELHHIDGNRFNNSFSNLQILCPNCHSLTPNHSIRKITITKTTLNRDKTNIIRINRPPCIICGKPTNRNGNKYCSYTCLFKHRDSIHKLPTKEELIIKKNELKSFVQLGKFYGKSDNAVRKWFNKYKIEY